MPQEIEIKFRVADMAALTRKLRQAGFRQVTPRTRESNVIFDLPGQRLRRRGELLRLRRYGRKWILTHKAAGAPGRHKARRETESHVADGSAMEAVLRAMGLAPVFAYEKFRSEWTDGKGHVVLDQTPIGDYAEIEGSPRWIDRTAARLAVSRRDYITASYAELFRRWKRRTGSKAQHMTFSEIGGA